MEDALWATNGRWSSMLAQGKIGVDQAEQLLQALGESDAASRRWRDRTISAVSLTASTGRGGWRSRAGVAVTPVGAARLIVGRRGSAAMLSECSRLMSSADEIRKGRHIHHEWQRQLEVGCPGYRGSGLRSGEADRERAEATLSEGSECEGWHPWPRLYRQVAAQLIVGRCRRAAQGKYDILMN